MKSLWNENEAQKYSKDDLDMRVYTSRLLGANDELVLHGGGNTSVKIMETNIFGEEEEILYVKGSGWDLATIERAGFSPCKNNYLKKQATLKTMSDTDMVTHSRIALTNPYAPTPSIEAILHGLIPFKFVDHTHADAVVTVSNTPNGYEKLQEIYGKNVLILPYIMPGFVLAKQIDDATKSLDWNKLEAIILMHHGIFTFSDSAKIAYENMITQVSKAEDYIKNKGAWDKLAKKTPETPSTLDIAKARKTASKLLGSAALLRLKDDDYSVGFASLEGVEDFARRGTVTPDHVISTKPRPMIIKDNICESLKEYATEYAQYFEANNNSDLKILDTMPRYALWKDKGILCFAPNLSRLNVVSDITDHTLRCVQWGEQLGGWQPLDEKNLFELEYWELEQAKLKKGGKPGEFENKIALVSGAASGIGRAIVNDLSAKGACVVALDINPEITQIWKKANIKGIVCDVTNTNEIQDALDQAVKTFGGIDILISNAGSFPKSCKIEDMNDDLWQKGIELNFTSHMKIIRAAIPYLKEGIDSSVVIIASKNVPAPGPSASVYSSAKAGITQLGRVAAFELGEYGIRVNMVHPNAIFDTGVWTKEVLESRAKSYGMSVDEYKRNNVLKTEITSSNVAELVSTMCSKVFSKTTGAQVPIDGGNERVI